MLNFTEYDILNATLTLYKLGFDVFEHEEVYVFSIPYEVHLGYGFYINTTWRVCIVLQKNNKRYKVNRQYIRKILLNKELRIKYKI